jgi:hypothetical protein
VRSIVLELRTQAGDIRQSDQLLYTQPNLMIFYIFYRLGICQKKNVQNYSIAKGCSIWT